MSIEGQIRGSLSHQTALIAQIRAFKEESAKAQFGSGVQSDQHTHAIEAQRQLVTNVMNAVEFFARDVIEKFNLIRQDNT